jgi:Cu(I)/Ag(I) efflux system membrane fusion protein
VSNRNQIILSLALVLGAMAVVGFQLVGDGGAPAGTSMEGHDHAAMMAGADQRNPVRLSVEDAGRIGVTFATVEERSLERSVEALGTVAYDETSLAVVNPKVEGWVERLYVDFTGAPVRRGEPLMAVYSPKLVSAREELALAARLLREAEGERATARARDLVDSARRRLAYWDVPEEEIRRIEETGEITRTVTLPAPASGVVVEKNVVEGDRITPGTTVYRIADLSRVWIEADVFEKDLGLVREGQAATVTFEAFPGRTFDARVTYVYPTVSMESRTGRIRLELANPGGTLKPGMYARIHLDARDTEVAPVVPRSAVLSTGPRALVFVQAEDGALVPREVVPGRTSGRSVQVLEGLEPGERVVSSAAFLVDAESNLGALTAGMEMEDGETGGTGMDHSDHDMGGGGTGSMDRSDHDTDGGGAEPMDHSGHLMPRDTATAGDALRADTSGPAPAGRDLLR